MIEFWNALKMPWVVQRWLKQLNRRIIEVQLALITEMGKYTLHCIFVWFYTLELCFQPTSFWHDGKPPLTSFREGPLRFFCQIVGQLAIFTGNHHHILLKLKALERHSPPAISCLNSSSRWFLIWREKTGEDAVQKTVEARALERHSLLPSRRLQLLLLFQS